MIEGGFFTAALAFVGILPAHDALRSEPPALPIPMTPSPADEVTRPTMTESPLPLGASVSAPSRSNVFDLDHNAKKRERTRCPLPPASTPAFIDWLREIGEFGELTQRRLLSLYVEYCTNAFEPVSLRRLQLQIGSCGVSKRRLSPKRVKGKYTSPTVYVVQPSQIARAA